MTKVLFLVSVRLLGDSHTHTHCNYWSPAARRVLCNLCSTSEQQGKWQRTREAAADAAERTQSRPRRRGLDAAGFQPKRPAGSRKQWGAFCNYQWELWAVL